MEGWRDAGMEGWKDSRMEGWSDGGMERHTSKQACLFGVFAIRNCTGSSN